MVVTPRNVTTAQFPVFMHSAFTLPVLQLWHSMYVADTIPSIDRETNAEDIATSALFEPHDLKGQHELAEPEINKNYIFKINVLSLHFKWQATTNHLFVGRSISTWLLARLYLV
jgi:hypothetical protein